MTAEAQCGRIACIDCRDTKARITATATDRLRADTVRRTAGRCNESGICNRDVARGFAASAIAAECNVTGYAARRLTEHDESAGSAATAD